MNNKSSLDFIKGLASEKRCYYFIASIMILVPVCEFITELFGKPFITQPIIIAIYGIAGLILFISHLLEAAENRKFYPTDIFYLTLIFFALIALIFSQNIMISTTGYYYDEFIYHFLAYFSLMLAGTKINDSKLRKNILIIFIFVALFHGVISLFQTFGFRITDCFFDPEWHRNDNLAFGLTQHNNFYAGLSSLLVAACTGAFIFCSNKKFSIPLLILSSLCFYCSISTEARIAWVANTVIILFYYISFIVMYANKFDKKFLNSKLKRLILITIIFIAVLAIISCFSDVLQLGITEFEKEIGASFEEMGTKRGYIWKYALESVPDYWLTGIGLDNFESVFLTNPKWNSTMFSQAKGHNEYIHTLATQGVFAAANYIIMLIYCCVTGIKNVIKTHDNDTRIITWVFLGMFAAYAAQAFFNSSVINIAMYFWITIGMTVPTASQKIITLKSKVQK